LSDKVTESQGKARSFKESQGRFARDHEAALECSKKGGEATRKVYARRRSLKEAARTLLDASMNTGYATEDSVLSASVAMLKALGVEDPTGADALMLAQFTKACRGDTEAARYVRDTAGERPSDQVHLIASERPVDGDLVASMTDEELALLAESRDTDVAPIALELPEKAL